MGYIGPSPNPGQNREVDDISSSFNGSTTAFTLQVSSQNVSPGSANAIIVSLGGVVQNPGTDYTVAASTLTFTTAPASGLSFFGLVLGQSIDTEGTADNSITSGMIIDQAVTLAKLPHGDGSSDGKFLRANNGADPTFETVSAGTTLSGSTNNTVTTVTGANAIQGETGLTFDGTTLAQTSGTAGVSLTQSSNTPRITFKSNNVALAGEIILSESSGGGAMRFLTKDTGGTETERFRVNPDGRFLIGTSVETFARVCIKVNAANEQPFSINDSGNNSLTSRIGFRTGNNQVGTIKSDQSSTQYNTSSDYRLKENAVAISDGITRIKTLKPYKFNWIIDETNTPVDGFFAHEISGAVPEAISGTKDKVADAADVARGDANEVGDPVYQQIDQAKLVPLLTAALQEAITKIETLETKVAALEAA